MSADFDIFIIGGGINGCGIARDAAGRGYSVALCEMNDLASGTSSGSTKLVHGGLRYLEHYEFRLVREALSEREVLWNMAPHIIWPLRFVLPYHKGLRPAWLLRLGLFLYDHIGGRKKLPGTRTLNLREAVAGAPLKPEFEKGFEYSDCWVNDARLVVLNAQDAEKKGAIIETRTQCIAAKREEGLWRITTRNKDSGAEKEQMARVLINASGPWVDMVLNGAVGKVNAHNVRLVQGSHIVVPRIFEHDSSYIFQNSDERIIFAIPYERDFTLIGTTDHDFNGDINHIAITPDEVSYLCAAASEYFIKEIKPSDVVWGYSGVRPLYDDGASKAQEATRDYVLRRDTGSENEAPLLNVFGGKITTYRRLSESMLEKVENILGPKGPRWTRGSTLPGGNFDAENFQGLVADLQLQYPFVDPATLQRYARAYGTATRTMLRNISTAADMGTLFGADLWECEVRYLMAYEWAVRAADILWRRSKLGLSVRDDEAALLDAWMQEHKVMAEVN